MALTLISGDAGTRFTNTTNKVLWQLQVQFQNSCGICIQYANLIGPYWPVPFHWNCACQNVAVPPGATAEPFVDYLAELEALPQSQKTAAVGSSNWKLIKAGVVDWKDVVTKNRIRDLHQVVANKGLTFKDLRAVGIRESIARQAVTPALVANELSQRQRLGLVKALKDKGVSAAAIEKELGVKLAAQLGVKGPSGLGGVTVPVKPSPPPLPPLPKSSKPPRVVPPSSPPPPSIPTPTPTPTPTPSPFVAPTAENIRDLIAGNDRAANLQKQVAALQDRTRIEAEAQIKQDRAAIKAIEKAWPRDARGKRLPEFDVPEEFRPHAEQAQSLRNRISANTDKIRSERLVTGQQVFDIIATDAPASISIRADVSESTHSVALAETRKAAELLSKITRRGVAPESIGVEPSVLLGPSERPYAILERKAVAMTSDAVADREDTIHALGRAAIHEVGHLIEVEHPGSLAATRAFLAHRTQGEALKTMRELDPRYDPNEVGFDDDFAKAFGGDREKGRYAGRLFVAESESSHPRNAYATELVSSALELLRDNPARFARSDPEYFKLILILLNGDFSR